MPTQNQIAKNTAKTLLSLSLLATYATKYGLDFFADMSKTVLGAATNMTDYFLDNKVPKLGIGDALLDKAKAGMDWTFEKAIQIQKSMKQKI